MTKHLYIFILSFLLFYGCDNAPTAIEQLNNTAPDMKRYTWFQKPKWFESNPTLVVFWANWNDDSLLLFPKINNLYKHHSDFLNLLVLSDADNDAVRVIVEENLQSPTAYDKKSSLFNFFKPTRLPFFVILDPNKKVLHQGFNWPEEELEELLKH